MSNYVRVGSEKDPFEVWYSAEDNTIHLTCNDKRLTDENGQKPGFRVVFSANPRSADYNPGLFNRFARLLRAQDKPAPAEDAPLMSRRLDQRRKVIADLAAVAVTAEPLGKAADPKAFGWDMCPTCSAVVVNLPKHRTATSC